MSSEEFPRNPASYMAGLEFRHLIDAIADYVHTTWPAPPDHDTARLFYRRARAFTEACEAADPTLRRDP